MLNIDFKESGRENVTAATTMTTVYNIAAYKVDKNTIESTTLFKKAVAQFARGVKFK